MSESCRRIVTVVMLPGFGIQGFRSFGGEMQFVVPLGNVTLVVGQNNAGKSNIIRFAYEILGPAHGQSGTQYVLQQRTDRLDVPLGDGEDTTPSLSLAIPCGTAESIISDIRQKMPKDIDFYPFGNAFMEVFSD
jgi:hypothetical protein